MENQQVFPLLYPAPVEENQAPLQQENQPDLPLLEPVPVDDAQHVNQQNPEPIHPAPALGMQFVLMTDFLLFYRNYAKTLGFQTRIQGTQYFPNNIPASDKVRKYNEAAKRCRLQCSKGGDHASRSKDPNHSSKSMKSFCPARVTACRSQQGAPWRVTVVELEHNHEFKEDEARFISQYREISSRDKEIMVNNTRAGIPINSTFLSFVMEREGFENTPMTEKDCRNLMDRERREMLSKGDFMAAKKYLDRQVANCKGFTYVQENSDDGQLRNLFWIDGRSREAFKYFGDVVSFDTTFLKNKYKFPFAPFVGINHHGQTILLGCGLLCGEETSNFEWLFEQWKAAMGGVAPKCIVTDQDKAISKAIKKVFPGIQHRLCLWHIMQNVGTNLGQHTRWPEIEEHLKTVLHNPLTILEFEAKWAEMINEYQLSNSEWLDRVYTHRRKWVPVYFKTEFWAGMSTTQRSEGMNNYFRGFVNLNTTITTFVESYSLALAKRVNKEAEETYSSRNTPLQLCSTLSLERVFQEMYTNAKFGEIQDEIRELGYLTEEGQIEDDTSIIYRFLDETPRCKWSDPSGVLVEATYNKVTTHIVCQCHNIEYKGIICRHIMKVFQKRKIKGVPAQFIKDRWRKDLTRSYVTFPIPEYTPTKKHSEPQSYAMMQSKLDSIAAHLLVYPDLVQEYMEMMDGLKNKADTKIAEAMGISVESTAGIGQVFHRRYNKVTNEDDNQEVVPPEELTKDPPSKRGRGPTPKHRNGYKKKGGKRKRAQTDAGPSNRGRRRTTNNRNFNNPGIMMTSTTAGHSQATIDWSQGMLRAGKALTLAMRQE